MSKPKKKKRIQKSQPLNQKLRIELDPPRGIGFSFKYWQLDHPKFFVRDRNAAYFLTLLERLKDFSSWTVQALLRDRSSSIRCHPIEWSITSENGFNIPNEAQLVDIPYQLSLSANEYGRIHGFFLADIFYIVWLDPKHLLYP